MYMRMGRIMDDDIDWTNQAGMEEEQTLPRDWNILKPGDIDPNPTGIIDFDSGYYEPEVYEKQTYWERQAQAIRNQRIPSQIIKSEIPVMTKSNTIPIVIGGLIGVTVLGLLLRR